jgi:hypothetical protein
MSDRDRLERLIGIAGMLTPVSAMLRARHSSTISRPQSSQKMSALNM